MWDCTIQILHAGRVRRYTPRLDGVTVRYNDVLRLWQEDEPFRAFFIAQLEAAPFSGYRWETPPITADTAGRVFEFVLLDTPGLDRRPDIGAFGGQFQSAAGGQAVLAFPNLGKDAILVVPGLAGPPADHVHLAAFIRRAPPSQVHELWRSVGAAMQARLSDKLTWLSTAGMGVAWLHVRLDSQPKYYGYEPYRRLGVTS